MGLLSRPAVDPEAMSKAESRWLFPLRKFEEEVMEHIMISTSCPAPWSARRSRDDIGQQTLSGGVVKERPMKDGVQRKFERLGKNVVGKVKTLKHAFSESHERGVEREVPRSGRDECRKVACNEIVRATLLRHPGSQLPDVFVSSLQAHFDGLPSSYARAGFNSEQVFVHIRLLEQSKMLHPSSPAVHLSAADWTSRSGNASEFSSTTSSPTSSVWEETEQGVAEEVIDVAFACGAAVSKPALVWAFEHEMISVRQATVFERKGVCLGVLTIQCARAKIQQEFVGRVIKAAIRKSRFSKFSLALCGCEVPGVADQRDKANSSSKDQATVSPTEDLSDFNDNYWNEADFNFTSTSFADAGCGGYETYAYPCYREESSPPVELPRICQMVD